MTDFIDIAALYDIPRRGARIVKTAQGCIAIFRTIDDQVFAIDDACPHKNGSLSEGIVHGSAVTCPLHGRVFDLEGGKAQGGDEGRVSTYQIKVKDGRILLNTTALQSRIIADT